LERSVRDRVLAGVIGGLSDYLKVDSNLLRIAAILLFIISPVLMSILYIIAVFLIPKAGEEKPLAASFEVEKYLPLIVGLILIIVGAVILGSIAVIPFFWIFTPFRFTVALQIIIAAILIIIGAIIAIPQLRNL
jgi:phage shock protein PspC (stress-responsive transcriptional regulator)